MKPNIVTTIRLLLLFIVIIVDYFGFYYFALLIILISFFSDILDGYISRKFMKGSEIGIYYDHFVDKIFVHLLLVYYLSFNLIPFVIVGLLILRDYLSLGLRQYAVTKKVIIASVFSGKLKMWLQAVYIIIIALGRIYAVPKILMLSVSIFVVLWAYLSLLDMFMKNKPLLKAIKKEF